MTEFSEGDRIYNQADFAFVQPMTVVRSAQGYPIIIRGDGNYVDRHGNVVAIDSNEGWPPYTVVSLPPADMDMSLAYVETGIEPNTI